MGEGLSARVGGVGEGEWACEGGCGVRCPRCLPVCPPAVLQPPAHTQVSAMVSREMERECVVVFDEAHNIDNVCIEALSGGWVGPCWVVAVGEGARDRLVGAAAYWRGWWSAVLKPQSRPTISQRCRRCPAAVNLRMQTIDSAQRNISMLKREIERVKETDAGRLRQEYQRLLQARGDVLAVPIAVPSVQPSERCHPLVFRVACFYDRLILPCAALPVSAVLCCRACNPRACCSSQLRRSSSSSSSRGPKAAGGPSPTQRRSSG